MTMSFNGSWKMERSENFDKMMTQMGVKDMTKKLADIENLTVTVEQTGDNFRIKESSQKKDYSFTLGVPFEYELADGTVTKGTWVLEGNVLTGTFTRKDNGKPYLAKKEVTGDKIVQTYTYDGVTAKRIYKKI
ncbi:fatty acid-binding protein, intestinal-like [Brienomyrus brachyistius]|uniref:fatty acid-binding protein, intestinal-like n=1 Tax=Brienomyrus brachyistius TaxID=42636 RepID=UPI0020B31FA3|nr:fatty acid-binding protein, intestinal-like [Brienomyrus brachyistius]